MVARREERLLALARLRLDAEQAKLADLVAQEKALRDEIEALPKDGFVPEGEAALPVVHKAELLWRAYRSREEARAQTRIARLRTRQEAARQDARRAFGQWQAIATLAKRGG